MKRLQKLISQVFHAPNRVSKEFIEKNPHCPTCGIALSQKRWDTQVDMLSQHILNNIKLDDSEMLDIIASFQEGFNTNIHCMELAKCLKDNSDKIISFDQTKVC